MRNIDIEVYDDGSIVLLTPMTQEAENWIEEHIPDDAPWFGHSLAVEARFAADVISGMVNDGLGVA